MRQYHEPIIILISNDDPDDRLLTYQAFEEIKSDPTLRAIPILILTTSKAEEDILYKYELGASSFITKPATFDKLIGTVYAIGIYWLETAELPLTVS